MNLEEILKDAKTFSDDLEMKLGENSVRLGDLRGLTSKQQRELSQRIEELKTEKQNAAELATKAATLISELEEKNAGGGKGDPNPNADDFDTSEWWKPVRARLESEREANKKLSQQVEQLTQAFGKAAKIIAEDRWEQQYNRNAERLKKSKEYADWDVEKVREYAVKHNIVDRNGFPSVERAIMDLTKVDEIQAREQAAYERGMNEGRQRARMASMARPSSASGPGPNNTLKLDPNKNFNDLGDAVMSDPDLTKMLSDLDALAPEDFGGVH